LQQKGFFTDLKLKNESEDSGSIFSQKSNKYGDNLKRDCFFKVVKNKKQFLSEKALIKTSNKINELGNLD